MPIVPSVAERLTLLRLNQGPGLMLDFLGAQAFGVLCTAVKLGVFESLSRVPLTAAETARQIGADQRGTTLLLEALESLGYVENESSRYFNTPMTAKWLLRNSRTSMACGIPFFESMVFERWRHLDESIRQGKPAISGSEWLASRPDRWRSYQEGMIAVARMAADEVVARIKLPATARLLLDVGGGHGLYSIRLCQRHRNLSATVFDLPPALLVARQTIAAEEMEHRVRVQEGDFWVEPVGKGYDVILLFNVIHAYSPRENIELLRKLCGALTEKGLIVVMEQIAGEGLGRTAKVLARLQALNFFNDLNAQTYELNEIAGWLADADFSKPRRIKLRKTPGFSLILATRA